MIRLTVEEMNLLSIYHEGSKAQLMENMTQSRMLFSISLKLQTVRLWQIREALSFMKCGI